jgi:outer membrane protein assembly factor BamA
MLFPSRLSGQEATTLRLTFGESRQTISLRVDDTASAYAQIQQRLSQLHDQGFLEASADSIQVADKQISVVIHEGKQYRWLSLSTGSISTQRLKAAGFRPQFFQDRVLAWTQWQGLQRQLLSDYENSGFPFAQVGLDEIVLNENTLSARILVDSGQLIHIGRIRVSGDVRVSEQFLGQHLGLKPGMPFDQSRLERLPERLQELAFLEAARSPELVFSDSSTADIILHLKRRKVGRFDFLVGVLPNNAQTQRMLITGNLQADLYNQFGRGERLVAQFDRLRPETQQLELKLTYPYLLQLPFALEAGVSLYRRDTSFLNTAFEAGLAYPLRRGIGFRAFAGRRDTRLLRLPALDRLPPQLDVTLRTFGLESSLERLDYRFNPRKGWRLQLSAAAGTRQILPNTQLLERDLGSLYDSLTLNSGQMNLRWLAERYWPLSASSALKIGLSGGHLITNQPVYLNEQFRIGGNKLMRGFDEEFFFTPQYVVMTSELRLLLSTNSYLYAFGDVGRLQLTEPRLREITAYGFGAGMALETRAGILGLTVALGAVAGTPLDAGTPKVHIGYLSLF